MIFKFEDTKYDISVTSKFKNDYKKIVKQNKSIEKLILVLEKISKGEKLDDKYKNHLLINDKFYKDCLECHIESDWLLIYQIRSDKLVLVLTRTGSHSDLFKE